MQTSDKNTAVLRINGQFVKREIAGDIILVPVGETALRFNGMITLTETASVIWEELEKGTTRQAVISRIMEEFDADEDTVTKDTDEFLSALRNSNFLTEE